MSQIIGNSVPIKIGFKVYLVSYVSLAEWETFDGLVHRGSKGKQFLSYLIYCSLHRADSTITKRKVRSLMRWHKAMMVLLVATIRDISLPPDKLSKDTEVSIDVKQAERNMKTILRILSRMHGWTPQQIGSMSPAQIFSYLMGGKKGTGIEKMSSEEYQNFLHNRGG